MMIMIMMIMAENHYGSVVFQLELMPLRICLFVKKSIKRQQRQERPARISLVIGRK